MISTPSHRAHSIPPAHQSEHTSLTKAPNVNSTEKARQDMCDERVGFLFFLDLYHASGKFRLVKRQRPRQEPRAILLRGHRKGKARPVRKQSAAATQAPPENRLGRPPTRNFRRPGTETSECRAPPGHELAESAKFPPVFRILQAFPSKRALRPNLQPHRASPRACGHSGHGHRHAFHADQAAVRSPSVGRRSAQDPGASARSGRAMRLGAP